MTFKEEHILFSFYRGVAERELLSPKEFENDTNLTLTHENGLYDASRGLTKYFAV